MPSNANWFCNEVNDQCYVKLYIDKQAKFLIFLRLIKIFGRQNWMLLRDKFNSLRYESDVEH